MDQLCIIVVFYNPTEQQKQHARLLSERNFVIVVDNSLVECGLIQSRSLKYFPLRENKGIAYAQNYGISEAQRLDFKYVLFQDQDSCLSYEQITLLVKEYEKTKLKDNCIGAIGPLIIDNSTGEPYKNELGKNVTHKVSTIISSGMLVEMETLKTVGLMEDALFIDNVDHEWCWRAQSKGFKIYMTNKAILQHSVGAKTKRIGRLQIIKSAPIRSYYKFRNNLKLFSRTYVPLKWKLKTMGNMIIEFFLYIFNYKEYGSKYIRNASRGIKDAITKR